ncbi:hypothetical protein BCR36DRAFT_103433 [Piromyces finnis]|uniref:Phosphatidylglycerol/phosphatidylinositol transfer protein n=1 Tax=Piromyces finnis TaxID=1754191 RepID=A0A1Y1V3P7_9FUNG|nr:hypothetical protein BCR36DRAFT_103433 [Piromyces finnis]|eukprot:ORX46419.1 hypothetical protein BCR36DRAFT_103433 [Piromyces finnis]
MKLFYFIASLLFLFTIVNSSISNQIVISKDDLSTENTYNKRVQKKIISSGHDNEISTEKNVEWYSCSSSDSILIIDEILVHPDPPKRGSNVKIELYGFLLRDIEVGSRIKISIKYGSLLIYRDELDLCELVSCPLKPGELYATYEASVYSYIPRGTYNADAYAWEPDHQEIACAYGHLQIV